MISKADKIIFGIIGISVILIFIFWKDVKALAGVKTQPAKLGKEYKETKDTKKSNKDNSSNNVLILQKWELPNDLKEVSGIAYLDDQRFACIQDEEGTIFIFNTASKKTEKEIAFAGAGDFEDIAVNGNIAYIVRADGRIYEVDMKAEKNSVKEYTTSLTVEHNVEGLCYDRNNNRLLLAIKDDDPSNPGYKGIYAFDLSKKLFVEEPVFKINIDDKDTEKNQKKKKKSVMPSALAIHPASSEIFITDGPKAQLLVLDKAGKTKTQIQLGKEFSQPEGITFSPDGDIFISNEGSKQPGNILKVELK
jgi:uncharacterized protein YjiK